jgi:KDO2-lipid IV(A) lauroyltransferase
VTRRLTRSNLAAAFPEKTAKERDELGRAALQNAAITFLELARMPLLDPRDLQADVEFENLEILDESLARGKGAVCLSGHFGNWEIMGAALVARGYPLSFMIGQQSNPWVDDLFNSYRLHCNIHLIPLKDIRQVLTTLKRNQFVAILGDQDGDRWGMFVPFFGRSASTFTGPAVFAHRTGADILFAVPVRLDEKHHKVTVHRLPQPPEGLSEEQALNFSLTAYNHVLEEAVRQNPGQWWWMHNRWEARPEHHLRGAALQRFKAGELEFDCASQRWKDKASGQPITLSREEWR